MMQAFNFCLFFLGLFGLLITGCDSPKILDDLGDHSWKLVNQDSAAVTFPDDFSGKIVVSGYIFTNCQGVCPAITTNMKKTSNQLSDTGDIHFVGITFDPMRDTPSVLNQYMKKFDLDEKQFTLLTGDSVTVYSLLDRIGIRTKIMPDSTNEGYRFNHTNQVNLIDRQGRVRAEYGGSMVPPELIIEDINKLK